MYSYNPMESPDRGVWLELDEKERINSVRQHHECTGVKLENEILHATMHTVIENQLAMEDACVQVTLTRLMNEGLDRHDALHAIGSILAAHLWGMMSEHWKEGPSIKKYYRGLRGLTAKDWSSTR